MGEDDGKETNGGTTETEDPGTGNGTGSDTGTEPWTDTASGSDTGTGSATFTDSSSQTESGSESASDPDSDTQTASDTDKESSSDTESESLTETSSESETPSESDTGSDSQTDDSPVSCDALNAVDRCGSASLCVDGWCCDSECTGLCSTCGASGLEGLCVPSEDGIDAEDECGACRVCNGAGGCALVESGGDPMDECPDLDSSSCSTTGVCDGTGKCETFPSGTTCGAFACTDVAGGESVMSEQACDGDGACLESNHTCGGYDCQADLMSCRASCVSSDDCNDGFTCNGSHQCVGAKPDGEACYLGTECESGVCADGVCCATACSGICEVCDASGQEGTCVAADENSDPRDNCPDCYVCNGARACKVVAVGQDYGDDCDEDLDPLGCGLSGSCNGRGACALRGATHVCSAPACSDIEDQASLLLEYACDGKGTCEPEERTCGSFTCADASVCLLACEDNDDCVGDSVCSAPECRDAKSDGEPCAHGFECASENCADNVCCASACDKVCERCDLEGSVGTCELVPDFTDPDIDCGTCEWCVAGACGVVNEGEDPKDDCALGAEGQCSTTGACAADGSCALRGGDYLCGGICQLAAVAPLYCDGTIGGCNVPGDYEACSGALECASNSACAVTCMSPDDCVDGHYCHLATGTCQQLREQGDHCESDEECANGNCVDEFCCDGPCNGVCESCDQGGAAGVCTSNPTYGDLDNDCFECEACNASRLCEALADSPAPEGDCTDATSCGHTGQCVSGSCQLEGVGTPYAEPSCDATDPANPVYTTYTCDGFGGTTETVSACGGYLCETDTACATTCSGVCADGFFCVDGVCGADKPLGSTCSLDSECASDECADGRCCENACTGECMTCGNASGLCLPQANGTWGFYGTSYNQLDCAAQCQVCSGSAGTCRNVTGADGVSPNVGDPRNDCAVGDPLTCGRTGVCESGAGYCARFGAATVCDTTCDTPNLVFAWHCSGGSTSACTKDASSTSCPSYLTCLNTDVCRSTCSGNADCTPSTSYWCNSGTCTAKSTNSTTCTAGYQCQTGNCVDGVCCNLACNGLCEACNVAGSVGLCNAIPNGQDPLTECADGLPCNGTDYCDGAKACAHSGDPCAANVGDADSDCSESCNPANGQCTANDPPDSACADGLPCNGTDKCDSSGGCTQHTGDPCAANIGDADADCSESCNPTNGLCTSNDPFDSFCNDGNLCNGADKCDTGGGCNQHTGDPCAANVGDADADCTESCNSADGQCTAADPNSSACVDSNWCSATQNCQGGVCTQATPICVHGTCSEADDDCDCGSAPGWTGTYCDECVVYVDANSNAASPNGSTWALAYQSLQAGVDAAYTNNCEVWVAEGTYDVTDYATGSLQMRGDVEIYGGFVAGDEYFDDREPETVKPILDGRGTALHVVVCQSSTYACTTGAVLDGFVLSRGYASVAGNNSGGGLYVYTATAAVAPQFTNLVVTGSRALYAGAGIAVASGSPVFDRVMIVNNQIDVGGNNGGGFYSSSSGTVRLTNAVVSGNVGDYYGGGLYAASGTLECNNCVISGNRVRRYDGGGVGSFSAAVRLANCTIYRNFARYGGAVQASSGSLTIANSILWGNINGSGTDYIYPVGITPDVRNSIVQGTTTYPGVGNMKDDPKLALTSGTDHLRGPVISASYDEATHLTRIVLTADPFNGEKIQVPGDLAGMFILPNRSDDLRMLPIVDNDATSVWVWGDATSYTIVGEYYELQDMHLGLRSPAIDYANPSLSPAPLSTDAEGNVRYNEPFTSGGSADIGAYEYRDCIVVVNSTGSDANDGSQWTRALKTPQVGVNTASIRAASPTTSPKGVCEVWLYGTDYNLGSGDGTLHLKGSVQVLGGFTTTYSSKRQREWGPALNGTTLSGNGTLATVVTCTNADDCNLQTLLDGVTVTGATSHGVTVDATGATKPIQVGLRNLDVSNNTTTTGSGAGLYLTGSNAQPRLFNSSIASNNVTNYHGGGLYASVNAHPTIERCSFSANSATLPDPNTAAYGGAIHLSDAGATVSTSSFTSNTAKQYGGAIYKSGTSTTLSIEDCEFSGNTVTTTSGAGSRGGAVGVEGPTNITRSRFMNNAARSVGGAVYGDSSTITIRECLFAQNRAGTIGGGACGLSSGGGGGALGLYTATINVYNSIFDGNSAYNGGAAYLISYGALNLYHATAVNNCQMQNTDGSVVHNAGNGYGVIYNAAFANNLPVDYGYILDLAGGGELNVNYTILNTTWGGQSTYGGNLKIDPLLDANYQPTSTSPCIDSAYGLGGLPTYDYDGLPRVNDPIADTGAGTPTYFDRGAREAAATTTAELLSALANTAQTGSSNAFDASYRTKKNQYLYLASELTAAGVPAGATITRLGFLLASEIPASGLPQFRIAATQTGLASFTNFLTDPLPWVAYGPVDVPSTSFVLNDWVYFPLSPSIVWDGVSNLVVEVSLFDEADVITLSTGSIVERNTESATSRHEGGYVHSPTYPYPYIGLNNNIHNSYVAALRVSYAN